MVDGDTLLLGTGERIRLMGVDTPETKRLNTPVQYFGKEATAFTKRMAEGKRIRGSTSKPTASIDRKDRLNRTLAYVLRTTARCSTRRSSGRDTATRMEFGRLEREAREMCE